ncbi:MAG: diguanylate cyclase [Clostridia bacterium]|nr:diguanylate cyclase [Clostridia bacterium]
MIIAIIVILILIVMILIGYNLHISKTVKSLSNTREMVANLQVLQDFMDIIGREISVEDKIELINNILIEKYNIKYSTIVVFNGAEYMLKASNVDKRFWKVLTNLHTDGMFKDSIKTATPKYVTINSPHEMLTYQKNEMARAKSAMFFPLYIDNVYIGYWIIESDVEHAFDNMDTNILGVIKENIISVLKTVSYQNTVENIYREDKTTGLFSAEYLYGKGKRKIDEFTESTICMFTIINIEDINEKYGRNIGTRIILNTANTVKSSVSSDYIFVRYMGPKFAIAFPGIDVEGATEFLVDLKQKIEGIQIEMESNTKGKAKKTIMVKPETNFVIASYYKGTGIEEVTKKLEEYLDNSGKTESAITSI